MNGLYAAVSRFALAGIVLFTSSALAQPPLPVPQLSPKATVTQAIGISEVAITCHRPGVKNRVIWGGLVPYNQVWRGGANENTTISFSDPVKVDGQDLAAGTYGLHMIPSEKSWTVIFSKNSTSWGSYSYKESEDALRVSVEAQPAPFQEWLGYEFSDLTDTSAVVALHWEKVRVPVTISTDTRSLVLANAKNSYLRGLAGNFWQGWNQAASYCLKSKSGLEDGLAWAEKSVSMNENFDNLWVKAGLLENLGREKESGAARDRAIHFAATESQVNTVGAWYLAAGKTDDAVAAFKKNLKLHPDSWRAYRALAEGYQKRGDTSSAIENYSRALALVKDEGARKEMEATLKTLRSRE